MMKNHLYMLLFCLLISSGNLMAQLFTEAPAPKVKSIVEWFREMDSDDQEVYRGDTYLFQKDGKLAFFTGIDTWEVEIEYFYDKRGRIEKIVEKDVEGVSTCRYAYKKRYYVEEWDFGDWIGKTFFYVNDKKQILERKEFSKDLTMEKPSFNLDRRTIYTYTKHDSLQGETRYNYSEAVVKPSWIIYTYDPETGKRKLKQVLSQNNEVSYFYEYEYDSEGRLVKVMGRMGDGENDELTEYLYKDGKIWQKIYTSRIQDRVVTVYKNGLPIRQRFYEKKDYNGFLDTDPENYQLTRIVDFQYKYYD